MLKSCDLHFSKNDLEESIKLDRRRRFEEERKKRIFATKDRVYGIDRDGIEKQLIEKKKQKDVDKERQRLWEQQRANQQFTVNSKSAELEKRKKEMEAELRYYRSHCQKFEDRREFDINRPDIKKISEPTRIADDDIRLGLSSAQILPGEDIHSAERKHRQREQKRTWYCKQKQEVKQASESHQQATKVLHDSLMSREKLLENMVRDQQDKKHQALMSTRDYNLEMARKKKLERELEKQETANDDLAEIYNMMTSDMLTQNRETGQSMLNPNKKLAVSYRGMTDFEMARFREDQALQRMNDIRKRKEKLLLDQYWGQCARNMDREFVLKEEQMNKLRTQHENEIYKLNCELAVKQKEQKKKLDDLMKRNHLSEDYFNQFNKSSR